MSIIQSLSAEQTNSLKDFLESDQVEQGCLDYIAMHGFLTGIVTGPESLLNENWLEFIFDGTPDYLSEGQRSEIESILNQLLLYIQRSLYLGEGIQLPCRLKVSANNETNDLTDWCFGFIEALAVDEEAWFDKHKPELEESVAELILPAGILSEQFDAPELAHLTQNEESKQQLADSLIGNIENLYLLYRE